MGRAVALVSDSIGGMYLPAAFALHDPAEMVASMRSIGVGHVVTTDSTGLLSSFVPLLVNDDLTVIHGHLARANQHRSAISAGGADALVIYTGPNAYVSPSWYPSKVETGEVVPTWNYELIHVRGRIRVIDDVAFVADVVHRLTEQQESPRAEPWSVTDAPADYLSRMYRAIVGFEITVEHIEAKRKFSQNRPAGDRIGVVAGLSEGTATDRSVAEAMGHEFERSTANGSARADDSGRAPQ